MPDDKSGTGVDLDEYQQEKDEFSTAFTEVMGADEETTDEDINRAIDKKLGDDDGSGEAGEATKDPDKDKDTNDKPAGNADGGLFTDDAGVAQKDNDTSTDTKDKDPTGDEDQKVKFAEVEAELKKERQKTSSWDGRIRAANQKALDLEGEIKILKAKLDGNDIKPKEDTKSDTEVLDKFRKDFPELADVVDVLQKRVDGVAPSQAKSAGSDTDGSEGSSGDSTAADEDTKSKDHLNDIYKIHPDLPEMVDTGVLLTWINKQKPFIKPALENIYYSGSTKEVIDMCEEFKSNTGWKSQLETLGNDDAKSKQEKLAALKEVNSESGGAPADGPDKNDFEGTAKEIGL